jgi:hypothetical protein
MKLRTILLIGLGWMAIAAPTPGAVGSCGGDDLAKPADFRSYCQQREQFICTRRFLRKEITEETRDICRWDALDACDRRTFPGDCAPSRRETEACLRALSSLDTVETPESEISECSRSALCKATPSEADDPNDAPENSTEGRDGGAP